MFIYLCRNYGKENGLNQQVKYEGCRCKWLKVEVTFESYLNEWIKVN